MKPWRTVLGFADGYKPLEKEAEYRFNALMDAHPQRADDLKAAYQQYKEEYGIV